MRKTLEHTAPPWLDPLEKAIAPAVFRYELARRTPEGRKRKLPRWDAVPPQVRLALRRMLSGKKPRPAWTLEPSPGFTPLTFRGQPLHLDLHQPDAVLLEIVKTALRHLRTEHNIRPRKAPAETRGTPWKWLIILDKPRGLDDADRAALAKARKIGAHHLPSVLLCFDHPAEVIRQYDAQLFGKSK